MMNMQLLNRSGLAAIVAATALLSTPALGQETVPATPEPAPIVADEPLPTAPTPAPTPAPEATSDPLAPAATTTTTARSTRATRPTRATAAPAARAPAPAARTTAQTAAPALAAPVTATAEPLPSVDPAMVAPLPEPVAAAPAAPTSDSMIEENMLPIAGAAGLGILALAGAGFALRRRRRNNQAELVEERWHEPAMTRPAPVVSAKPILATAPVIASAPVASSAFGWSSPPRQAASTATSKPLNRIEAAKRGPTPDNPSLSLKKRLKRAAFFDQRDRQIAAGMGTPISATAGLPDSITPVTAPSEPLRRSNPGLSMSFGKTFQPA